MKMYIVDKSFENLKRYENIMVENYPNVEVKYFTHCKELLDSITADLPDMVIIDAEIDLGMLTAEKVEKINNNIKIVISANNERYAYDSMQKGYYGYLKKPFTEQALLRTIKAKENCKVKHKRAKKEIKDENKKYKSKFNNNFSKFVCIMLR